VSRKVKEPPLAMVPYVPWFNNFSTIPLAISKLDHLEEIIKGNYGWRPIVVDINSTNKG
jgi:hypothetical protein